MQVLSCKQRVGNISDPFIFYAPLQLFVRKANTCFRSLQFLPSSVDEASVMWRLQYGTTNSLKIDLKLFPFRGILKHITSQVPSFSDTTSSAPSGDILLFSDLVLMADYVHIISVSYCIQVICS